MAIRLVLLALAFQVSVASGQLATEQSKPAWRLADGTPIDESWLIAFIAQHRQAVANWEGEPKDYWQPLKSASLEGVNLAALVAQAQALQPELKMGPNELPLIDLSGASLPSVNLDGLVLRGVNLTQARVTRAALRQVHFQSALIAKADFSYADARDSLFENTDAAEASFEGADLSGSMFYCSNVRNAKFIEAFAQHLSFQFSVAAMARFASANLREGEFLETDVEGATFHSADLFHVKWGALGKPSLGWLVRSKNLEQLQSDWAVESGMVELRKWLMEAGLRDGERKVTYALNRSRDENVWREGSDGDGPTLWGRVEVVFRKICFDWPCSYGLEPGRPLKWMALLCLLSAIPYAAAMLTRTRVAKKTADESSAKSSKPQSGIWAVPLEKRVTSDAREPVRLHVKLVRGRRIRGVVELARLALFFSVISAFSTGYRDLDVGRWIERVNPEESTLQGTGWVRVLSGVQSLLSFYLLALWLLTYFGRPFE